MKTGITLEREQEQATIFLDIETIPAGDPIDPATLTPPGNLKKKDTIDAWYAFDAPKIADEQYHKRSLDSMQGQILCIGYAVNDNYIDVVVCNDGEANMLKTFETAIKAEIPSPFSAINWVAHNGLAFDFKWLKRKAIKYNLPWFANSIQPQRYGGNCIDTNQLWQCGDWKDYTKLQSIADFLGIPGKNGIDGSMVYQMYLDGKIHEIVEYCRQDVEILRAIYKRIMFLEG